jgi:hypothetical protein
VAPLYHRPLDRDRSGFDDGLHTRPGSKLEPFDWWSQRLMRPLGVVVVHPGIQSLLQLRDRGVLVIMLGEELGPYCLMPALHLPVVVGDRGAVNRCRIPFSAQIRSNTTSAELPAGPNRPVKTLPLSVRI